MSFMTLFEFVEAKTEEAKKFEDFFLSMCGHRSLSLDEWKEQFDRWLNSEYSK